MKVKNWRISDECIHCHTLYCNHANNSVEEMVEYALQNKYKIFGISEHIPFVNKKTDINFHNMRPTINEYKKYYNKLESLKVRHKNKIKILIGLESEYYLEKEEYIKSFLIDDKIDYLILGNHSYDYSIYYSEQKKVKSEQELMKNYIKNFELALKTDMYLYVAHPDFIFKSLTSPWNKFYEDSSNKIATLLKRYNKAAGFNINGIISKKITQSDNIKRNKYPVKEFWNVMRQRDVNIFIEQDAHSKEVLEQKYWDKAIKLIEDWNLEDNIITFNDLNINEYWKKIMKNK